MSAPGTIDEICIAACETYNRPASEAIIQAWKDVLGNYTPEEVWKALKEHQSDTTSEFSGGIRGERMPLPSTLKVFIERDHKLRRWDAKGKWPRCGHEDCHDGWRYTKKRITIGHTTVGPRDVLVERCKACMELRAGLGPPEPPPKKLARGRQRELRA